MATRRLPATVLCRHGYSPAIYRPKRQEDHISGKWWRSRPYLDQRFLFNVTPGHIRSYEPFLLQFLPKQDRAMRMVSCVQPVKTDRLICMLIFFGHHSALMSQDFRPFQAKIWHYLLEVHIENTCGSHRKPQVSMCLDERNRMEFELMFKRSSFKVIYEKPYECLSVDPISEVYC